jgi:IS5 family transposase
MSGLVPLGQSHSGCSPINIRSDYEAVRSSIQPGGPPTPEEKYTFIRWIETDTASTHDSQHFDNVFDTSNTSRDVYADRGYPSEDREAWLKAKGFRNPIQRKGKCNKPLSECQQQRCERQPGESRHRARR